jgi:hypothetical protein
MCHRFGKISHEVQHYEHVTSKAFDTSFGYRFVSQLRDYVAHCGFPIENMSIATSIDDAGHPVHEFHYSFNPRHLLNNGPSYWRGRVKADLIAAGGPIAVEPILVEAISELRGICEFLTQIERPYLHASAKALWDIVGGVFAKDTVAALGKVVPVKDGIDLELLDLPARMLERLGYVHIER